MNFSATFRGEAEEKFKVVGTIFFQIDWLTTIFIKRWLILVYMALLLEVKYETSIKDLKDISPDSVLSMLRDVRDNIKNIDGSFAGVDLTRVLTVVEAGTYEVNGSVSTRINLSSAKGVINAYREYSEGGCKSWKRNY